VHSNISYHGLKDFIITDSFMKEGVFHPPHKEVEREPHPCPSCNNYTNRVHNYRTQKVQHTNIFSRESILFYRTRRYVCGYCKKRFKKRACRPLSTTVKRI